MGDTVEVLADIISSISSVERETIQPELHIFDDLGVDSLDFLDIAYEIDLRFEISLPIEEWIEEVNAGRREAEEFFVMRRLADQIDQLRAEGGGS